MEVHNLFFSQNRNIIRPEMGGYLSLVVEMRNVRKILVQCTGNMITTHAITQVV